MKTICHNFYKTTIFNASALYCRVIGIPHFAYIANLKNSAYETICISLILHILFIIL